ncbi:hypothetical protein Aab01nite_52870 [Paractinoplanes abujensis]|uniref:Knr4/Smi1-like domain-containing protein n=1 Tax=Paractinoplanes abujensis TaxID=882441 RepID=A0A7W7CRZ1_9ACTN|nr:HEAT repeat domain-containing protein [Actinoplanes abujensis]MBB4693645.1 hypothetical protein [Actinoplanes abujensis]GID21697.1 hypothetical protein Aab01nite_52870 [Actinoplanes abujensis]
MDAIARIRTKLAALPRTENATLGPVLSEDQVAGFEQRHGIRLPEEFRQFVTRVGHGGYGPTYGLLPITRWASRPGQPAGTSPLIPDAEAPVTRDFPGTIAVVHGGCLDWTVLVVSGPGRGRLVEVNADGLFAPYFHADAGFLSWYERWLDFVGRGAGPVDLTWFAQQMAGDEHALLDTLRNDARPRRRRAAAYSFITYPQPSGSLPAALVRALAEETDPAVRETIVRALAAQGPHGRELLPAALSDPSPDVRSLAVILMAPRDHPQMADVLAEHLRAENDDAVRATVRRALHHE